MSLTRRVVMSVTTLFALALMSSTVYAESTLEKARQSGHIRVGFANESPYAYVTASGELTGESPSIFKHVMHNLGVKKVEGVLIEWGSLIPGLKAGRFDAIVASMYVTPKRCKQIIFSNPTYGMGDAFIVKSGNPEGISTYKDAVTKGKKIAFVAGTVEVRNAKLAGLSRGQRVIVPDFASAVAAVKASRVSAAALTALTAKELASKDEAIVRAKPFNFTHGGKVLRGEGAFAFRKRDTELRDAINKALAKFIGTPEHLAMVKAFGFDQSNLPEKTAAQLCAGE
ncbi:MAG: ectoine/hydroxyectoine ABC transporter substrate-binding protein EhuB [Gallionella sp.]